MKVMRSWRVETPTSKEIDRLAELEGITPSEMANQLLAEGVRQRRAKLKVATGLFMVSMSMVGGLWLMI